MNILYTVIVLPIERIIEWVFLFYNKKIGIGGAAGAVFAVSLAVNFLALPLYTVADNLSQKEHDTRKKMEGQLDRIKKTFRGDERFMMLQAYYRETRYHPLYALRASLSILLEVPFFIAAYHFLSNSDALRGVSFLFIRDMGSPDGLISLIHGGGGIG